MGASRYLAVTDYTDEATGRTYHAFADDGYITGSDYERLGEPKAFRPADYPSEVDQLREEYGVDDQADAGVFDPADHTVDEVNAYLHEADVDEKMRVLDAERASDNPRKGVLDA